MRPDSDRSCRRSGIKLRTEIFKGVEWVACETQSAYVQILLSTEVGHHFRASSLRSFYARVSSHPPSSDQTLLIGKLNDSSHCTLRSLAICPSDRRTLQQEVNDHSASSAAFTPSSDRHCLKSAILASFLLLQRPSIWHKHLIEYGRPLDQPG
jgi:hypothetical protein